MKGPLCGMTGNLNPEGAEFPQGNYFRPGKYSAAGKNIRQFTAENL
jgi:hypothetical protein